MDKLNAIKDKQCYNLIRKTSQNIHRSYNDLEYRKKLSESVTIAMHRPDIREKNLKHIKTLHPTLGTHRSTEFKQLISNIHTGKILSSETKNKIRQSRLGIVATAETKMNMTVSQFKRWDTLIIEAKMPTGYYKFDNRTEFRAFVKKYNQSIPIGRVNGPEPKRINWKKALNSEYPFIKIIKK